MTWETILGIITHPAVQMVVTAIAGVAIAGFVKYRAAYAALIDIPQAVLKARKPGSPGGKHITEEEYASIGQEVVEFIGEVAVLKKAGKA